MKVIKNFHKKSRLQWTIDRATIDNPERSRYGFEKEATLKRTIGSDDTVTTDFNPLKEKLQ